MLRECTTQEEKLLKGILEGSAVSNAEYLRWRRMRQNCYRMAHEETRGEPHPAGMDEDFATELPQGQTWAYFGKSWDLSPVDLVPIRRPASVEAQWAEMLTAGGHVPIERAEKTRKKGKAE
jgi:hypothetical protein